MRRKLFAALAAGVTAIVTATAGTAYAISTFRIGGITDRQYIATSDAAWLTPGPNTWQTVPSTGITVLVTGTRKLITARFNAESLCVGPGWCSARIVYTGTSIPATELAPQSGSDFAFDTDGDSWSAHSMERTSATYLPPGVYQVSVQAMRVSATQFRLDDYHLNVATIAP